MIIGIYSAFHIACSIIGYYASKTYLTRKYPRLDFSKADSKINIYFSLFGPIFLIVLWLTNSFKHGIRFK